MYEFYLVEETRVGLALTYETLTLKEAREIYSECCINSEFVEIKGFLNGEYVSLLQSW